MKAVRRYGFACIAILGTVALFRGDYAGLALNLQNFSFAALILVLSLFLLGRCKESGVLPELDLDELVGTARQTSYGAATVWIGLVVLLCTLLFVSVSHGAMIDRAGPYLPELRRVISAHWPAAPVREAFAGQIEQESQWKKTARLHTSREDGRGLAQLTIAYNADGSERFNAFRDAVRIKALRGWDWRKDPENVRYQMTYLVMTDRSNFSTLERLFATNTDRWGAALVAYNAGMGTVLQRRSLAKLKSPELAGSWFGGLDKIRLPYESRKLYGRDLGEMRNEYPRLILHVRAPKYRGLV